MRYLKTLLAAALLAAGIAEAAWYWSPRSYVQKSSSVGVYTGSNNARCIAGIGQNVYAVYARDVTIDGINYPKTYFTFSTDMGGRWSPPWLLAESDEDPDSALSPSVGLWTPESLLAIWHDGEGNGRPIYIKSSKSVNHGVNWTNDVNVNTDETETCKNPALFCERYPGTSPDMTASALWSAVDGSYNWYIGHRAGQFEISPYYWIGNRAHLHNPGTYQVDYPTIWTRMHGLHAAYVRCENEIWYENGGFDYDWESDSREQIDNGKFPSLAFEGVHEAIAYEKVEDYVTRVKLATREWLVGGWSINSHAVPAWADSVKHPHLFATENGNSRRMYIGATGFYGTNHTKMGFVEWSSDGGESWDAIRSASGRGIMARTDSVSLWAEGFGTSAYLRNRVWAIATGHTWTDPVSKSIIARVASEHPIEVGPPAGLGSFGGNSACRVARQPGTDYLHRAHPIDNFISYERSSDNGATWDFQDAPDFGTNPTLALYNGNPVICYLRDDTVFSARMNSDSEWTIKTIFAGTPTCKPGIPSLAVFPNAGAASRMANACFPLYSSTTGGSKILLAQFDTAITGGVVLDTISSNTTLGDSAVTVAVGLVDTIEVCFEHGDSIYYKYLRFSSTTSSPPDTWTKYTLVNTGNTNGRHPYVEKVGTRFYVTYSEHWVEGGDTMWAIKRTSCCDTLAAVAWEGRTSMSAEDEARKDFPSMSSGIVVAWAESSSATTHWVIKAKVGDSLLTLTDSDTNSKFVSILADTAVQTSPSTSTTGIYYLWLQQYSGDTWQVPYAGKQVLTSNAEANVTRYNQGRKLLLSTDDTLSSVYRTAAGSIYYSKKKDGVEGWTSSLLRSTGQFPCLTEDYLNRTWVAEHDATSPSTHLIRCQNRAAGSNSWHDFSVYSVSGSGPAFSRIGPPSIVACQNDSSGQNRSAAYIVFTVYTTIPVKSTIVMAKVDTLGVVYVDTLHYVTTYGDSFPSIAACPVAGPGYGLDVAFQSGTEVYTKKTTNSEHPEFTTKRTWSPSYNLSNTPLKSKHPLIAADADTVLVAWVEGDSGAIVTKGQGPGSGYTVWGGLVSVSACPDTVCDNPTIALGDSIIVAYHKKLSATNYDVIARVNFNSNLNLSNSTTTSKYPHCAFHFHNDSFPVISTVWTEELSTNYAEVAYKRWQLGEEDGGGIQNAGFFDPNIHPCLFAPSPNPFNGLTSIRYSTNIKGLTRVTVMDITGRRVRNLLTMPQSPGIYNLTWNARDDRERQLPRGVYFVRLQTENYSEARKLILTE